MFQLDKICSDCFDQIFSIPLPDCRAKFHIGIEELSLIVGSSLTCQTTVDDLRLLSPPPSPKQVHPLARF